MPRPSGPSARAMRTTMRKPQALTLTLLIRIRLTLLRKPPEAATGVRACGVVSDTGQHRRIGREALDLIDLGVEALLPCPEFAFCHVSGGDGKAVAEARVGSQPAQGGGDRGRLAGRQEYARLAVPYKVAGIAF